MRPHPKQNFGVSKWDALIGKRNMLMSTTIGPTHAIVSWIPHIVVVSSGSLAFRLRQQNETGQGHLPFATCDPIAMPLRLRLQIARVLGSRSSVSEWNGNQKKAKVERTERSLPVGPQVPKWER